MKKYVEKVFIIFIICIFSFILYLNICLASENIVENGDFSNGLSEWNFVDTSYHAGSLLCLGFYCGAYVQNEIGYMHAHLAYGQGYLYQIFPKSVPKYFKIFYNIVNVGYCSGEQIQLLNNDEIIFNYFLDTGDTHWRKITFLNYTYDFCESNPNAKTHWECNTPGINNGILEVFFDYENMKVDAFINGVNKKQFNIPSISSLYVNNLNLTIWNRCCDGRNDVYFYFDNITLIPYSLPPSEPAPPPTNHSIIISSSEWKNVISAGSVRNPVLVSERGGITPEIQRFIQDYRPDYIYTIGFDSGFNGSFEITKEDVPGLFFPNAAKAVYVSSGDKGVFASLIGNYLGMPVVFEKTGNYSELDLEAMTVTEIQDFYLERVKENKGKIDYLILADMGSSESLLAGYIAGAKNGYIVTVSNKSFQGISNTINEALGILGSRKLYHKAIDYKAGKPLYLAILGGNESIPYVKFFDPGLEIFNDKDGWWLYSDLGYSDSNGDGFFDLALGRMEGLEATSLHMARGFLPKNKSVVLIGEYRYPKFEDLKMFGGGMTQAFSAQILLDLANVSTKRIVEKRGTYVENWFNVSEVYAKYKEWLFYFAVKQVLSFLGKVWGVVDLAESGMYGLLETDWKSWEISNIQLPPHSDFIDETLPDKIGSAGVVGYFGVGKTGWTIPKQDRSYLDLIAGPYEEGTEVENLEFPGFVYDDHDMSAKSSIKESIIRNGGGILTSSGVIHDPYTMHTSNLFFSGIASGKPVGQALIDSVNMEPVQAVVGFMFLNQLYVRFGQGPNILAYPFLYTKDKFERILFSDPAVKPLEKRFMNLKIIYHVGPANSFQAESVIESNYTEGNNKVDVWNADDYLIEKEKPIIPIFVREFVLPENSVVNWVNVSGIYSLKNASPVLVYNDSYYSDYIGILVKCINSSGIENEQELEVREEEVFACMETALKPNVTYPYPNSSFWWVSHNLLDNRTLVYVFVPAVLFENGSSASVLENASIQVDYEAWTEMNVLTQDVFLGQNETIKVEVMNLGEEASGTVWIFVEGNGSFEFSENVTILENSNLTKEFSFAPGIGDYEVAAVFDSNNSVGPRYAYFSVDEPPPAIAVPEVNETEQIFLIKPAYYSEKSLPVSNSGNAALELEISCEGFPEILCEIVPQNLDVLPGEEKSFAVNVSVPGGYPAGEYSGKIVLIGNEFSFPKTKEVPLRVSVPEAAYWSVSPLEWVCTLPECSRDFFVANSPDSNAPLHADIALENLDLVSVQGDVSVDPGQEKNVTVSAGIPDGGILSGVYSGNIIFECGEYSEPSGQKINVTLVASGPEFTIQKEFQPGKILLFWKRFVVPKINHVEIYLNSTGDTPIEKINISDEIPDGWKGKKPVIAFVKRNKSIPVKEFSFSSGNGYANFSFDFAGKPLQKGEGLEVHYLIYGQPEFVPSGDIITNVRGEARSHENIYSKVSSSAKLNVEYFNPPTWLRWLFILIYRLW